MKIAIEAQRIFRTNKHGMDFVALEVIRQLQRSDQQNEYYILVAPGEDHCLEESGNFHIVELRCPSYPLWEQVALPLALRRIIPDLLHCTSNTAPLFCSVPLVVTLHDIIFLEKRRGKSASFYQTMGWYYRRWVVPPVLKRCRRIVTVSHFERTHILEQLRLDPAKVKAIYNGYSEHFKPIKASDKVSQQETYIFFLGNTDPKKNTLRTFQAYALYLERSQRKYPLLVADLKETLVDRLLEENQLQQIKPYLRFAGYIPNSDLPAVYGRAFVFLYPSLRESFGIPILEAMACGVPLITSNTSSMPEIAGLGALLIDPHSAVSIADAVLELECDPLLYQKQVQYGLARVAHFSWRQTADELLNTYREIVAPK